MIFVSGVHGVGKSYFCKRLNEDIGIESYASSDLIGQKKNVSFTTDKKIAGIDDNQNYLITAVEALKKEGDFFVLDGHFCLLDNEGEITRIPEQTFIDLKPEAIVLLTERPQIICERRFARDKVKVDIEQICRFQEAEIDYAGEIAEKLGVQIIISKGSEDLQSVIDFIRQRR